MRKREAHQYIVGDEVDGGVDDIDGVEGVGDVDGIDDVDDVDGIDDVDGVDDVDDVDNPVDDVEVDNVDGIVHCHNKRAQTMTHIDFPIALMGRECASFEGTRSDDNLRFSIGSRTFLASEICLYGCL